MYTKTYMYDPCREFSIELLEDGFVKAFEETLHVVNHHPEELGERQQNLQDDLVRMQAFVDKLKNLEDLERTGSVKDSFRARIELADQFREEKDYHWLAEYIYKSCCQILEKGKVCEAALEIDVLERLALLEERRNNIDSALTYMEKAFKESQNSSLEEQDPRRRELNQHLIRVYQQLSMKYLEEQTISEIKKPKCVLYAKKAAKLARLSGADMKIKATCYALLGRAAMKFNDTKRALKNFQSYLKLSQKCNDVYESCIAYYALSETFNSIGDLQSSAEAVLKCQELAKENNFLVPAVFSSIRIGQLETAKRNFAEAHNHFEDAFHTFLSSRKHSLQLHNLCSVMCGIGRAHLDMKKYIANLQTPDPASHLLNERIVFKEDINMGEEQGTKDSLVKRLVEEELSTDLN
ncbi:hypothetical protein JTE90_000894 [Oedothorax gibbosus]|uniref:Tetratricopeptide repeat protein 29 n=1 Tax=Oedothorax gibbosus TaxID=931172 RepID=A0AAV6VVP2_9ARAC|nr:hypothetical protein JTE90_000894 [Oedothorax gibbosus]